METASNLVSFLALMTIAAWVMLFLLLNGEVSLGGDFLSVIWGLGTTSWLSADVVFIGLTSELSVSALTFFIWANCAESLFMSWVIHLRYNLSLRLVPVLRLFLLRGICNL